MTKATPEKSDQRRHCASILIRFDKHEQSATYFLDAEDFDQLRRLEPVAQLLCDVAKGCLAPREQATA